MVHPSPILGRSGSLLIPFAVRVIGDTRELFRTNHGPIIARTAPCSRAGKFKVSHYPPAGSRPRWTLGAGPVPISPVYQACNSIEVATSAPPARELP
jgi:hypothetical protein